MIGPEGHDSVLVSSRTPQVTIAGPQTWHEALGAFCYEVWPPAALGAALVKPLLEERSPTCCRLPLPLSLNTELTPHLCI